MKKARPPACWLALEGGDAINTRVAKHKIDAYLAEMRGMGYEVGTEETKRGYRVLVHRSPHDKPKRPHLRIVK